MCTSDNDMELEGAFVATCVNCAATEYVIARTLKHAEGVFQNKGWRLMPDIALGAFCPFCTFELSNTAGDADE